MNKNEFLQKYPWPKKWTDLGNPLDYLWEFDLPITTEKLWPYLIDTSTINQRMGVPRMEFAERQGRLFGRSKNAGIEMEWEEVPWQWEYGKGLNTARIYSKGLANYVRSRYVLAEPEEGRTRLWVYFGWIPRSWYGRLLLIIGMKDLHKKYEQTLNSIVTQINQNQHVTLIESDFEYSPALRRQLQKAAVQLAEKSCDEELVQRLFEHVESAPNDHLDRIRPRELAFEWDADPHALIKIFLHATKLGLFYLSWDVICPHCRGVRQSAHHLWDVPTEENCEVCQIDFETASRNSLEVTFRVHEEIRPVERVLYCAAEPAKKPHIKYQHQLAPDEERAFHTPFQSGYFRLRIHGQKNYTLLQIDPTVDHTHVVWEPQRTDQELTSGPQPTIAIKNDTAQPITAIIEAHEIDERVTRPGDLFNFQEFRDLFDDEALSNDLQLDVGIQNILFVDVVGSTQLYQTVGDGRAFSLIRHYFQVSHDIVQRQRGAIIKTIGDALMMSFSTPEEMIRTAIDLQHYFNGDKSKSPLRVRISLNRGNCLAVNLNSKIDYFGQTVNIAAKLQSFAQAGDVVLSDAVHADTRAREPFQEHAIELDSLGELQIAGYGPIDAWQFHIE